MKRITQEMENKWARDLKRNRAWLFRLRLAAFAAALLVIGPVWIAAIALMLWVLK